MNFELLIARRILFSDSKSEAISRPVVRIAIAGVAVGFAVMILAISIVTGFKKEIREKVIGFGSHIQISNFDKNNSYESTPLDKTQVNVAKLQAIEGVAHIQEFATKAGIIKAANDIEGVVVKGVGMDFDWTYFRERLIAPQPPQRGETPLQINDSSIPHSGVEGALISKIIADKLRLKVGDKVIIYFIPQYNRPRPFYVSGIYQTGLEEFDNKFVLVNIDHIRKLNNWTDQQTGGYEIAIKDFERLSELRDKIYENTDPQLDARSINKIYPQIFGWLDLQDINGVIIITLMLLVAGINMISALIIIILERVKMIGMLKAMGSESLSIRKIFLYVSAFLIGRGLLIGNIIGVGLCLLQNNFHFVHLDQQSYYISYVPVSLSAMNILFLNAGSLIICVLMMILPTLIITRISPLKAIRYS